MASALRSWRKIGTNNFIAKCLCRGPRLSWSVLLITGSDNPLSGAKRWPGLTLFGGPNRPRFRATGLLFFRYSRPPPFPCGLRFIYRLLPRPYFFVPSWSALGLAEAGQDCLPRFFPHSLSTIISYLRSIRWPLKPGKFL